MPDILKVTTPTTGYENSTRTNPINVNDSGIKNIIDTSKVSRPDGRTDSANDNPFLLNYESNFDKFIQLIRNTPGLRETLGQLLFTELSTVVSSGIDEGFAEEIAQFMEMLKMNDAELLGLMKDMSRTSVKFKGAFFNIMRQVFNSTSSVELKSNILDFLKKYNDFTSEKHILGNIFDNLSEIVTRMPKSSADILNTFIGKLIAYGEDGKAILDGRENLRGENINARNAAILKEEILPEISRYISRSHDMGKIRDFVSLLTINIARYESAGKDNILKSFKELLAFSEIREKIGDIDPEKIFQILENTDFAKGVKELGLMERLADIIAKGASGNAGHEAKTVFANIAQSLVLNESVYMPLLHLFIPANINGNMFFSEMWVDPDSGRSGGRGGDAERTIRLLIKFDIKDIGFFDVVINVQGSNMEMQVFYPEKLSYAEKDIRTGIMEVGERNGFKFKNLYLDKTKRPLTISEVFPQIAERRNAINVRI